MVPLSKHAIEPVQTGFIDFTGRTSREAFWSFVLIYFVAIVIVTTFEIYLGTIFLTVISSVVLLVPSLAITTRRLHDTGLSGWWQLIGFVPLVGLFVLAVLLARRGTEGENQYGDVSLDDSSEIAIQPVTSMRFGKH